MSNKITKSTVISSLFWKFMEMGGMKGIGLIIQIVLARLLAPDDFGTIAIVLAFVNIAMVFVDSGLNNALIQKKDADKLDFSTVFYSSLAIAAFFYLLIYALAPVIANFYNDSYLVRIIRVLALILVPGALSSVQNAYISKNMLFKKLFKIKITAVLISGAMGIISAYLGMGVWALVAYNLGSQISTTLIMWFSVKWRPSLKFSFERFKSLFSFGGKLLLASLIHTLYVDLRTLVIGRIYSPDTLGYYNRGESVPKTISSVISGSIQAVMFPTLSSLQDDKSNLKRVVRRSIKTISFLVFPAMAGLAVIAEPFIRLILGAKWLPAVPFMQIFCVSAAFEMLDSANYQAINALGRSDINLKLEIIKKIIGITILAISIAFGIYAIALGYVISSIINVLIHMITNKGIYGYRAYEQLGDIMPSLLLSLAMGTLVYLIGFIDLSPWLLMIVQMGAGALIYSALAKLFQVEIWDYLSLTVKDIVRKRKAK